MPSVTDVEAPDSEGKAAGYEKLTPRPYHA